MFLPNAPDSSWCCFKFKDQKLVKLPVEGLCEEILRKSKGYDIEDVSQQNLCVWYVSEREDCIQNIYIYI